MSMYHYFFTLKKIVSSFYSIFFFFSQLPLYFSPFFSFPIMAIIHKMVIWIYCQQFLLSFMLSWCHSIQAPPNLSPKFMFLISFFSLPYLLRANHPVLPCCSSKMPSFSWFQNLRFIFLSWLFLIAALLAPSFPSVLNSEITLSLRA